MATAFQLIEDISSLIGHAPLVGYSAGLHIVGIGDHVYRAATLVEALEKAHGALLADAAAEAGA